MLRFQWSKEVRNYLRDNEGLINNLELAFADYRQQGTRLPAAGVVDEIAPLQYIWGIHEHIVLFRLMLEESVWKVQVEVIKPTRSISDKLFFG